MDFLHLRHGNEQLLWEEKFRTLSDGKRRTAQILLMLPCSDMSVSLHRCPHVVNSVMLLNLYSGFYILRWYATQCPVSVMHIPTYNLTTTALVAPTSFSSFQMLISHLGLSELPSQQTGRKPPGERCKYSHVRGTLNLMGSFSPISLMALTSSSVISISWKLAAMRLGVTDLGITL